jgi:hypothetical protein
MQAPAASGRKRRLHTTATASTTTGFEDLETQQVFGVPGASISVPSSKRKAALESAAAVAFGFDLDLEEALKQYFGHSSFR